MVSCMLELSIGNVYVAHIGHGYNNMRHVGIWFRINVGHVYEHRKCARQVITRTKKTP